MSLVSEFFSDIDHRWALPHPGKIRLRIIGSAALMLQTHYSRGTKDGDVIETSLITPEVKQHLLALAPRDVESATFKKYRMYIDVVPPGLPFLPQSPLCHPLTALNATLRHLEFEVLDVLDVVVIKNLHYVQEEMLVTAATEIELPDWIV